MGHIMVIAILTCLYLWEVGKRVKRERQANTDAEKVFAETKEYGRRIEGLTAQLKEATDNYAKLEKAYIALDEKHSRHNQPRDEKGRFISNTLSDE